MPTMMIRRTVAAGALVSAIALLGSQATASADTFTKTYHGDGYSDKGLALVYARAQVYQQAIRDGFTYEQCIETEIDYWYYEAHVTWECSRET
jgi:hypothetical protein